MMGHLAYVISGALVGFLVGMTGVGGGSLMTPLLILLCGIHPKAAVGTDLIYAAVTKLFGTALHRKYGPVRWSIVLWMMAGSLPGVAVALLWLRHLGSPQEMAHVIRLSLGICLLVTAPAILFRPTLKEWVLRYQLGGPVRSRILTVVLGFVLGCMVSLSSVGAGAIGMAVLVMLYPTLPLRELVAIDIAHAIPLTLIAGAGHWVEGDVMVPTLLLLLSGSLPGIWLGTHCVGRCPERWQRLILGTLLLLIGVKMI